jgi:SAM-dependent methyltransferase
MAAYVAAADRYFRELKQPRLLFAKPYVPLRDAAYNVARLGFLLHHLGHQPHHTVLDFGAGMCWLTSVLLHSGCRVVALDVSETALSLGAEAIQLANHPSAVQEVQLLTYDGFSIPLGDGTVDRVACYDALHHVPNKRTVLSELHRVLRRGGRACFVEPGPGHASSPETLHEAREWGVLEDEVDAAALCAMALEVGFTSCYVVPLPPLTDNRLDPDGFQRLREGSRQRVLDWTGNDALIVLSKLPDGVTDSRSPGTLAAEIEILQCPDSVTPGAVFSADLHVTNRGDTLWLALRPNTSEGPLDYEAAFLTTSASSSRNTDASVATYRRFIEQHGLSGEVTIGAQLWPLGDGGAIDIDYGRGFLSEDIWPGQSATVTVRMRAPADGGPYKVRFDGVAENVTWFADGGAAGQHMYVRLAGVPVPSDSRHPGLLRAVIRVIERPTNRVLRLSIENTGDTIWLAKPIRGGGWVRFGAQLVDGHGVVLDRDWRRVDLPRDVLPGETVSLLLDVSDAPAEARAIRCDLVNELRSWFEDQGSQTLTCAI